MKHLHIRIEEDLDQALTIEAAKRKTSKAALIREFVREKLQRREEYDPFLPLIGDIDEDPVDDIDEVIYGQASTGRRYGE